MDLPRLDPLGNFNFYVALIEGDDAMSVLSTLASFLVGGFSEVSGLEATIGVFEYREGGVNDRVFKFPDRASYANIVLKRGVGLTNDLWSWHQSYVNGEGATKNGLIILANDLKIPIKVWMFYDGIPIKWSGPSLNAMSAGVAIESLEISHEKLEMVELSIPGL